MKIKHYLTFDNGSGPVSLVSVENGQREIMVRIVHNARFNAVTEVDPDTARKAVAGSQDLGEATTSVPIELEARMSEEALTVAAGMGCRDEILKWTKDGDGVLFANAAAAAGWKTKDDENAGQLVRPRRRMMMG